MTTVRQRIAIDTRYALAGLPVATVSFALAVTGVAAGVGSFVAVVGLPVLAATALAARRFADAERESVAAVLGKPVARPRYRSAPPHARPLRRLMSPLASGQTWLDLLHAVVGFPLAVAAAAVTAVWWVGAIAGLTFPLYGWIVAALPEVDGGLPALLGLGDGATAFVMFNTAVGALFAVTLPPVVRGAALAKASLAKALLARPARPLPERPSLYADLMPVRHA
jgi:hypothetical protein